MVLLVFITSKSELLTLPWSWSIRACMRSWFFLSSSPAKVSSLIVRSDLRRFLQMSPLRLLSASNSDSNSLMRVPILIMALRPPFSALTSASSARAPASLHWASRSFLSFSRFIATSCSQRSSSASLAASTIALAALSSESLASLQHPVHNGAHLQGLQHPPLLWQPYPLRVWLHCSSHPNQPQAG